MQACPFCLIVDGLAPARIVRSWDDCLAFVPLGPVVEGHTLVVPRVHVKDFAEAPGITGMTAQRAAELAQDVGGQANLITSMGESATQSVFHLHFHIVPRKKFDGLKLPWSGRKDLH